MKVVIPVGALHIGGGCKVLAETANALVARGHDTEIIVPKGAPVEYELHCQLTQVPSLSKEYIPYGDIVLPNFYTTFQSAYEAWPEKCVRFSLGFEPYWVPDPDYAIWTYAQGVPTISISHWLDDQIYNHVGQRGRVVNLGVDPDIFYPNSKKRSLYKDGRKVILYMARDPKAGYKLKGYEDFFKCMKYIKKLYKGKFIVHMICTERELPLPGIPHRIFRPKNSEHIARLYRTSDVFVSTSWFEGFAIPPLEAQACGTPVVTTNSGGVLDFCEHLKSAYIVEPKNPKSIAKGILSVLRNKRLAYRIRKGGLRSGQRLTKGFFDQSIVDALEAIHAERSLNYV
jgi:glycosyltransferase involved in cell wall biosynthesis